MRYAIIEKFIKDNRGEEITKNEGNFSSLVWGTACLLIYSPLLKKYFSGDFGSLALLLGEKKGVGFFNFDQYRESTRQALKRYLTNRKEFTEVDDFRKNEEEINKIYSANPPAGLRRLDDKRLEKLITRTFELIRDWQVITLFCEALDKNIAEDFFDRLKPAPKAKFEEFMRFSQLVDFQSFVFTRNMNLLDFSVSDEYKSQWIFGSYLYAPPLNECRKLASVMTQELGGLKHIQEEQRRLQNEAAINKIESDKFRRALSGTARDLYDFIKIAIWMRDVRKESTYHFITVLSNAIREMFSRLGYFEEAVIYTIYSDFTTGRYKSPGFKDELARRKRGFVVYFAKTGEEIEYVDFNEAKREFYASIFNFETGWNIKGTVAHKGVVKGYARIILSSQDFPKFHSGDILITSMTRPEFVPLMKKAAAVVTDEGGITCHAAIISRELGITCIVGTKAGTAIIEDGNFIEVDADKGIVKVLREKE